MTETQTDRSERLLLLPISSLRPHPANPNIMEEELLAKLVANISRQKDYPPLIVRPHPTEADAYQVLDGHQRLLALQRLNHASATCYLWPCSDADALILIATLNRLHGEDRPAKRAELLAELSVVFPVDLLAGLLPEDEDELQRSIDLLNVDLDKILHELTGEGGLGDKLVSITFAVTAEESTLIESAVARAAEALSGQNRRGRALATIAERYLRQGSDE